MSLTQSTMLHLGTRAPDFTLPDPAGTLHSLEQVRGNKGLLVMFICNHCPYVQHIQASLTAACHDFMAQEIGVVAINANDIATHPEDAPEHMATVQQQFAYSFPYLFDATQQSAKAYQAACTPDFFLFDHYLKLHYRGRFDASTPGNGKPVTGNDLRQAVANLLQNQRPLTHQSPSMGCNIKWRTGNTPEYFT